MREHIRENFIEQTVSFLIENSEYKTAASCSASAKKLFPNNIDVQKFHAATLSRCNMNSKAAEEYESLVHRLPNNIELAIKYADALLYAGQAHEAETVVRSLLRDHPSSQDVLIELSLILMTQGKFAEAEHYLLGIPEAQRAPSAIYNLGWIELMKGNFRQGLKWIVPGFSRQNLDPQMNVPRPKWQGQDVRGRRVLIVSTGGYGDGIIAAKFAKTLRERGATPLIGARPEFADIFRRAKWVEDVLTPTQPGPADFDYWISGVSVFHDLGCELQQIPNEPFLTPHPEYLRKWKQIIPHGGIGIRWSGNSHYRNNAMRKLPAEQLFSLATLNKKTLFSLQRDEDHEEINKCPKEYAVVDLAPHLENWEDTLAAVCCLDLVITSCTAIAHLAAAAGRETWVVVPVFPFIPWAERTSTTSWYKNVRVFHQKQFGSWQEPLNEVRQALAAREGAL